MSEWGQPDSYGKFCDDLLGNTKSSNENNRQKRNTLSPFHEIETNCILNLCRKLRKIIWCLCNGCGSMILKYSIPTSWRIKINGEPLISNHLVVG